MKKLTAVLLTLMVIILSFTACGDGKNEDTTTTSGSVESITKPAENLSDVSVGTFSSFAAPDLSGKLVDESIFKSKKLTMINIWATFCSPCIKEMPDLEKLNKEYSDKGFQVIGIVCDVAYSGNGYEPSLYQSALDVIEATGVTYTNLLPSDSLDIIKLSEVYSVPETIFVDENGEIIGESYIGSRSLEDWKAIVDPLLEAE